MDHRLFLILDLVESRSGKTTTYYFGDAITKELANYGAKVSETTTVGKFALMSPSRKNYTVPTVEL